jgi:hypothetical protein
MKTEMQKILDITIASSLIRRFYLIISLAIELGTRILVPLSSFSILMLLVFVVSLLDRRSLTLIGFIYKFQHCLIQRTSFKGLNLFTLQTIRGKKFAVVLHNVCKTHRPYNNLIFSRVLLHVSR